MMFYKQINFEKHGNLLLIFMIKNEKLNIINTFASQRLVFEEKKEPFVFENELNFNKNIFFSSFF